MLDLKLLREDPDRVRAALARRGPTDALDELLELDARRRELLPEVEGLRAEQNRAGQAIADAKRSGGDASEAIREMQGVASRVKELQAEVASVDERIDALRGTIPNLPAASAPDADEVLREVGEAGA
ncbi:MAG: seryl-tRNA synthetase, partial [Thermoleophilaceae bacterium]|nr:seryl-tRNA synthetase [Thermoleophilaceae bacterium]